MESNKKEPSELEKQVRLGFREAYKKLVAFKKKNNSPLIVSRNGVVVAIPPDEIPLPPECKTD